MTSLSAFEFNPQQREALGLELSSLNKLKIILEIETGNELIRDVLLDEIKEPSMKEKFWPSLCKRVDDSSSSLNEWVKTMMFLIQSPKFAKPKLNDILGFISCCSEYQTMRPESGTLLSLAQDFEKKGAS